MIQSEENIQGDNYDIAIVVVSFGSLVRELAEGLAAKGLKVLVVVPGRDYKRPDVCFKSERINSNLFIERVTVPRLDKNSMFQKLVLFCCFAYRASKTLAHKKINSFLAPMMPVIIPYQTFLISRRKTNLLFFSLKIWFQIPGYGENVFQDIIPSLK